MQSPLHCSAVRRGKQRFDAELPFRFAANAWAQQLLHVYFVKMKGEMVRTRCFQGTLRGAQDGRRCWSFECVLFVGDVSVRTCLVRVPSRIHD